MAHIVNFLEGLIVLPWWGYLIIIAVLTHITALGATIYLHRYQTHKSLTLHPIVSHFFRFWLWLTTGMITKEWVAIHRKHHEFVDSINDPHSPQYFGIKKVFFQGAELYQAAAKDKAMVAEYGKGTVDDWLEKSIYSKHDKLGISIMLIINIILFGPIGLTIWAIQMLWTPITAAGIINGLGHWFGYRNFGSPDNATNIFPIGILIGGEELHNNHHTFIGSAKFSVKWYELDLGWLWIKAMSLIKLAKINKSLPILESLAIPKKLPDMQTLNAVIRCNPIISASFVQYAIKEYKSEITNLRTFIPKLPSGNKIRLLLLKDKSSLSTHEYNLIGSISQKSKVMAQLFQFRADLATLWQRKDCAKEELLDILKLWCSKAENCGIKGLSNYSQHIKSCILKTDANLQLST